MRRVREPVRIDGTMPAPILGTAAAIVGVRTPRAAPLHPAAWLSTGSSGRR
jgi:hypothetical protein